MLKCVELKERGPKEWTASSSESLRANNINFQSDSKADAKEPKEPPDAPTEATPEAPPTDTQDGMFGNHGTMRCKNSLKPKRLGGLWLVFFM